MGLGRPQTPADTRRHPETPADTLQTLADTRRHPTDTRRHPQTPGDTCRHRHTPADTHRHPHTPQTPADTRRHLKTPADQAQVNISSENYFSSLHTPSKQCASHLDLCTLETFLRICKFSNSLDFCTLLKWRWGLRGSKNN